MEQIFELWRMVWRRFWIIAIVATIGVPVVMLYAYLKLPLYQAEAKILVESQRIPDELARSTVTVDANERLQLIKQRLMARDNVVNLIREFDLYTDRDDLLQPEKIDLVRQATKFIPITVAGQRRRGRNTVLSAFTIRVIDESPQKAAALANKLVTEVLELNIESRSQSARETTAFFTKEQERLNREIIAIESEITEFKEKNKDALPDSVPFRQAELSRLGEARLDLDKSLLEIEEERRTIRATLDVIAQVGAPATELSAEALELKKLESALLQKQAVLSPTHPEIRALRNRVAALEKAINEAGTGSAGATASGDSARTLALRNKLELLEAQAKLIKDRRDVLEETRAELTQSLQRTPAIEIRLNALTRKLTERQEMHAAITRKKADAETGERLELNQQAERFEVIENAIVPQWAIAPNRKKIAVMGSGLVLVLAFGLALMTDQLRPRIRSAAQLERQLGLTPVVSLPYIRTRAERRKRFLQRGSAVVLVIVAIPAGLYAVDKYYKPLPLLADTLAEKSGADKLLRMIEKRF